MSASLRSPWRGSWQALTFLGWLCVAAAAAMVIAFPAGWPSIVLAGGAVMALARNPRLGPIPASLMVTLALPYGLGADTVPVTIGGWPLRPQDAAIAVGLVLLVATSGRTLAGQRARMRDADRTVILAFGLFALVGGLAIIEGFAAGHVLRDVLRDTRWWFIYLIGPLALLAGVPAANVVRGLLLGMAIFATVVIVSMLLPAFGGGLKAAGIDFYSGSVRMQFGNSVFLMPALAYSVRRALEQRHAITLLGVALFFTAVVVSLTRTTVLVAGGVVVLVVVAHVASAWRGGRWRIGWGGGMHSALAVLTVLLLVAVTTVGAIGFSTYATLSSQTASQVGSDPLRRLIFSEEGSDIDAILESGVSGGRIATYLAAYDIIKRDVVFGQGMGELVPVRFASDPRRAYTRGQQPGVDNAYLTVGMKAGVIGITAFAAMLVLPLLGALRRGRRTLIWFVPAWLGILAMTLTQSFAVSGYSPFGLSLLAVLPFLPIATDRVARRGGAGSVGGSHAKP